MSQMILFVNIMHIKIIFCYRIGRGHDDSSLPPSQIDFEIRIKTSITDVYAELQKKLQTYRDEKRGPTMLIIQSVIGKLIIFWFIYFFNFKMNNFCLGDGIFTFLG